MHHHARWIALIFLLLLLGAAHQRYRYTYPSDPSSSDAAHTYKWEKGRALGLTGEQCKNGFPGLEREIENAVREGRFGLRKEEDDVPGSIQGRIRDGKVGLVCFHSLRMWGGGLDGVCALHGTGLIDVG